MGCFVVVNLYSQLLQLFAPFPSLPILTPHFILSTSLTISAE